MEKFNILDCTLRDGGYYNNWNFSKNFINEYLKFINNSGIEFVELGFSQLKNDKKKGLCYNINNQLLTKLKIPKNIKIGIMINAQEIIKKKINPKNFRKLILKLKKISFLRVACHFNEVSKILPHLKVLKFMKIKLAINLMQISEQNDRKIQSVLKKIAVEKIDIIYFADSLGCMSSSEVIRLINLIKKTCKKSIGFHAHDNMGNARNNVKNAISNGSSWVDTTVFGMGRGAGNARTEDFVNQNKKKIINNLKKNRFNDLKNKYKWGYNRYYNLSAKYNELEMKLWKIKRLIDDEY